MFPQATPLILPEDVSISYAPITQEQCTAIEEKTRSQSKSVSWSEERKNRLTASLFGNIIKRKSVTQTFLRSLNCPKCFSSVPTSYGKNNERNAIEMYIKKTGHHVHDCGLVVNPKFPFLGATPDGKVCDNGKTGLVEIKCPYSARDLNIREAVTLPKFCLKENDDHEIVLKSDHNYFYQVQGQMMTSAAPFCDFVVYTRKDLFIQRIYPDIPFMQQLLNKLSKFYFENMQPFLNESKRISLSHLVNEI